jgi:hypothetical protein
MATRENRLAEFSSGTPTDDSKIELLCEDHAGTYVLPFACRWIDEAWRNASSGAVIDARVVGWRRGRQSSEEG